MNHFKKIVLATVLAAASIATSSQAAPIASGHPASLIGDTITMSLDTSSASKLIGAGTEFAVPATVLTTERQCFFGVCFDISSFGTKSNGIVFDFSATALTITTPNGFTSWGDLGPVTFSGFDAFITGVSFASVTDFGLDLITDVSFKEHSITFDLDGGVSAGAGSRLVYKVTAMPEPATVALLGLGLLGFAASRRKSAKSGNA